MYVFLVFLVVMFYFVGEVEDFVNFFVVLEFLVDEMFELIDCVCYVVVF